MSFHYLTLIAYLRENLPGQDRGCSWGAYDDDTATSHMNDSGPMVWAHTMIDDGSLEP